MKLNFFAALLIGFSFFTKAQTTKNVEPVLFRINALYPGVSYELGAGRNSTFNFEVSVTPIAQTDNGGEFDWVLFPSLGAEFRYFTNMNRRVQKGKNISGNSGNYVSFLNQAFITAPILGNIEYDGPVAYLGAIVYGLQRTYEKGFYFGFAAGPAFFTGDNDPSGTLYLDARIGWVINRK